MVGTGVEVDEETRHMAAESFENSRRSTELTDTVQQTLPASSLPDSATVAALVAAGLEEKDAMEVEAYQRAMDEATLCVQRWAAQQVKEQLGIVDTDEVQSQTACDDVDTDAREDKLREEAAAQLTLSDDVDVPVHIEANGEEFVRISTRLDTTVDELTSEIWRRCALVFRPTLRFKGRLMGPATTLWEHTFHEEWLSFTYEREEQLAMPLELVLLQEQERKHVSPEDWKRWLRITDKKGVLVELEWDGNDLAMDFTKDLLKRFPMKVKLECKLLAEVSAAIATCSEDMTVRIWNARTGECYLILRGHEDAVNFSCFAPDNATIVTCSSDHTIKIWSLSTGECLHTLHGHTDSVSAALFSPDRTTLLTYSEDCTAKLWNLQTLQCVQTLKGHSAPIYMARFDDGGTITTAGQDRKMLLWRADTGRYMRALMDPLVPAELYSYSPDGRLTVTSSPNRETSVWDLQTGRCELLLGGHERQVTHAIFSPASDAMVAAAKADAML